MEGGGRSLGEGVWKEVGGHWVRVCGRSWGEGVWKEVGGNWVRVCGRRWEVIG